MASVLERYEAAKKRFADVLAGKGGYASTGPTLVDGGGRMYLYVSRKDGRRLLQLEAEEVVEAVARAVRELETETNVRAELKAAAVAAKELAEEIVEAASATN